MSQVNTKKSKVTFEEWIDEIGTTVLAKKMNVTPATIRHWRIWRCDPLVGQIRKLKKLSRGALGYEEIIDRRVKWRGGVK